MPPDVMEAVAPTENQAAGMLPSGTKQLTSGKIPSFAWWVLALMTVDYMLAMIDRNTVSILKTTLKEVYQVSDSDFGLLVTAFLVPYAIFYIICGRLVDRFGSRVMFTLFVSVWSLSTIAMAFARTWNDLVLLRVVMGAAEAGLLPSTIYAMVRWFPRDKFATVYAIKTPFQSLGAILSPPLIVGLTLWYGWQSAFVVPGVIGLIFAALWWWADRSPPDYPVQADLTPADLDKPTMLGMLATRPIWGLIILRCISDPVWFFFQNWQAGYMQDVLGASLADVGALLWLPPLATAILTFGTAGISDRLIRRGWMPVPSRLRVMQATIIFAPLIAVVPFVHSVSFFLVVVTTSYFMGFTWLYLSNVLCASVFPKSQVGLAVGLVNCAGTVGAAIFNYGVGFSIDAWGYAPVFIVCAMLHPLTAVFVQYFYRKELGSAGRAKPSEPLQASAQGAA